MIGTEIIELLKKNLGEISSAISAVTGALITGIFLRNNTSMSEFEKVKAGQFEEVLDELLSSGKMTYTELYKARNFLSIAKKADKYSSKKQVEESSPSYDYDWFIRFYEAVGNISNDDMQEIWAKILAGEINCPHSFSLKTIDVLKNISKADAELFAKICKKCFIFGNTIFLPHYKQYLDHVGITYSMIMYLSELGLIYNDSSISIDLSISQENRMVVINGEYILIAKAENGIAKQLSLMLFPLTTVGRELASLNDGAPSLDDLISFANAIKSEKNVKFEVHKIQSVCNNQVEYDKEDLLSQDFVC